VPLGNVQRRNAARIAHEVLHSTRRRDCKQSQFAVGEYAWSSRNPQQTVRRCVSPHVAHRIAMRQCPPATFVASEVRVAKLGDRHFVVHRFALRRRINHTMSVVTPCRRATCRSVAPAATSRTITSALLIALPLSLPQRPGRRR